MSNGTLGGFSNEAGVNLHVERLMQDILRALGVEEQVTIRPEVEVMSIRPDFMLILVNGHPIGTIEGKQPGEAALTHHNILGEVYDQLKHLNTIFRVRTPFAILTSYEAWRICWLNTTESNEIAAMSAVSLAHVYETPLPGG